MKATPATYAKALHQSIEGLPRNKQEGVLVHFLAMLSRQGKMFWIKRIIKAFQRYGAEYEKRSSIKITLAHELEEQDEDKIKEKLVKQDGVEQVVIKVDKNLVGGAKIEKGFTTIDASIKGQLTKISG